jgi:uncharacterized membrane protein YfcA
MWSATLGLLAGFTLAIITAPVGVSGAVFLLPFQVSVLEIPSPAVTPTNLLFNVVSVPGALLRYRRQRQLAGRLARLLVGGTLPGVVVGATLRVQVVAGDRVFKVLAAVLLIPLGCWLLVEARSRRTTDVRRRPVGDRALVALGFAAGLVGGLYGIGGGSILGPILVGQGMAVAEVAPATLASTFVTSVGGLTTFVVLAVAGQPAAAPDWLVGIACGLGGLAGGYCGARLQPRLPERFLSGLLGMLAVVIGILYVGTAVG